MNNHNPFELAEQEAEKHERNKRARDTAYLASEDMKWLMGSKRGRRIAFRVLERTGMYRSSYSDKALLTAFNEGQRNVGLVLMAQIHEVAPESYTLMMKEQNVSRTDSDDGDN